MNLIAAAVVDIDTSPLRPLANAATEWEELERETSSFSSWIL